MGTSKRYPVEVRERAVRLVFEHRGEYETEWAAIRSIAEKFGVGHETLRKWVRRAEIDDGRRPGLTSVEAQRVKELEREVKELRRANEMAVSTGGRNGSCGMTQEPIPEVVDAWAPERRAEAARFQTTSEWLAADGYRQRDRVFGAYGRAEGLSDEVCVVGVTDSACVPGQGRREAVGVAAILARARPGKDPHHHAGDDREAHWAAWPPRTGSRGRRGARGAPGPSGRPVAGGRACRTP